MAYYKLSVSFRESSVGCLFVGTQEGTWWAKVDMQLAASTPHFLSLIGFLWSSPAVWESNQNSLQSYRALTPLRRILTSSLRLISCKFWFLALTDGLELFSSFWTLSFFLSNSIHLFTAVSLVQTTCRTLELTHLDVALWTQVACPFQLCLHSSWTRSLTRFYIHTSVWFDTFWTVRTECPWQWELRDGFWRKE